MLYLFESTMILQPDLVNVEALIGSCFGLVWFHSHISISHDLWIKSFPATMTTEVMPGHSKAGWKFCHQDQVELQKLNDLNYTCLLKCMENWMATKVLQLLLHPPKVDILACNISVLLSAAPETTEKTHVFSTARLFCMKIHTSGAWSCSIWRNCWECTQPKKSHFLAAHLDAAFPLANNESYLNLFL